MFINFTTTCEFCQQGREMLISFMNGTKIIDKYQRRKSIKDVLLFFCEDDKHEYEIAQTEFKGISISRFTTHKKKPTPNHKRQDCEYKIYLIIKG